MWTDLWLLCPLPAGAGHCNDRRLSSVCPSVPFAYIGPKSKTERPFKTKLGTEVPQDTCDSHTDFKVKRSKVKVTVSVNTHMEPKKEKWLIKQKKLITLHHFTKCRWDTELLQQAFCSSHLTSLPVMHISQECNDYINNHRHEDCSVLLCMAERTSGQTLTDTVWTVTHINWLASALSDRGGSSKYKQNNLAAVEQTNRGRQP